MQVDSLGAFAARSPLDLLAVAAPGRTRCVNAENPTGGKGAAATAASALGPSRKGSPCIQTVKAGESVTLMDVDGPGVIRHIWMTEATIANRIERCMRLELIPVRDGSDVVLTLEIAALLSTDLLPFHTQIMFEINRIGNVPAI